MKRVIVKYLIILLFMYGLLALSCNKNSAITYYIQNTHEYWDTVTVCIFASENSSVGFNADCTSLSVSDTLLWCVDILKTDTNTFYKKEIILPAVNKTSKKYLYEVIKYRDETVSSGGGKYTDKTLFNLITLKNNGYAYDLESLISSKEPDLRGKTIIDSADSVK